MKLRKILALGMSLALAASMAACGGSKEEASKPAETATESASSASEAAEEATEETAEAESYTVGICQLVQHPALDAATKGFRDAITEALGENVTFNEQNASGDSANCSTIVTGFVSDGVDLIMANATAPLQAAAAATADIPILGTSITHYGTALEIPNEEWEGHTNTNVSGTSDLAPLDEQAAMINELFPDAQSVGLLYCSAEPNSVYQCTEVEKYLKENYSYEVQWFAFNDTNDVASVTQSACDAVDVIYIPTDNTAASNTEAIANIVIPAGIPVIAGEEGICAGCGIASLTISYYDLGYTTGQMAVEILTNGTDAGQMDIQFAPNVTKKYNKANCEALNITIPEGYEAIEE